MRLLLNLITLLLFSQLSKGSRDYTEIISYEDLESYEPATLGVLDSLL